MGMEMRNGVWTSRGKSDDADEIARIARRIKRDTKESETDRLASKIVRLAESLARDLRG